MNPEDRRVVLKQSIEARYSRVRAGPGSLTQRPLPPWRVGDRSGRRRPQLRAHGHMCMYDHVHVLRVPCVCTPPHQVHKLKEDRELRRQAVEQKLAEV